MGALVGLLVGYFSHWNTRCEAFAVGAIVVIASLCALWLKKRLYGSLSYWDAIIPMLFFMRVQWETYLGTTNPAHGSLPLLLIMLYGLAWTCRSDVLKYPLVLVLNFLAIYTGFGLFMGLITPALLAFDGYRKFKSVPQSNPWYAMVACAVSVASLAHFFGGYVEAPAADCFSFPYAHPTQYILFMNLMFARFVGVRGYYFPMVAGGLMILGFLAVLFVRLRRILSLRKETRITSLVIITLMSFSLLFGTSTAIGRVCLGLDINVAGASRYMIYLVPGFLGLYFHALSLGGRLRRYSLYVFLALSILASFPSGVAHKGRIGQARLDWKNCYLKIEDIAQCNELASTQIYPVPKAEATRLKDKLNFLKNHQLNLFAK